MIIYIVQDSYDWEGYEIILISDILEKALTIFNNHNFGDEISIVEYNIQTQENKVIKSKRHEK